MKSAVTISLVQEARGGPFVFWDDLPGAIAQARELGFDAIELFAPGASAVDVAALRAQLSEAGVALAAVGTGAGWVRERLTLTSPDGAIRARAVEFIRSIIDLGAPFGAPAIIGSMQGRWGDGATREQALEWLRGGLNTLAAHAAQQGVPLLYEPLNRYETNLCNTLQDGVAIVTSLSTPNVKLLADLFHMNIEEVDMAAALRGAQDHVGHIHFVDSNRRPAGCGHLDYEPIIQALCDIQYSGYLSAEALPWPAPNEAAAQTIRRYRELLGSVPGR